MSKYRILKMKGKDCKESYYRDYHYTEDIYVTQKLKSFLFFIKYWKTFDVSCYLHWSEAMIEWDKEREAVKKNKKSTVKVFKEYE